MLQIRKIATSNATSKLVPNSVNLFCWNQLKRDFEFFGYKNSGAQCNEILVYVQGIATILPSDKKRYRELHQR